MNGRLYDPVLGRMLSPDPYIQAPDNTQSYNRYSYVWNNPLMYTDPSGEIIDPISLIIIGAVVGGFINWGMNGAQFNAQGLKYFGVGALAGGVGAGVGVALAGAGIAGFVGGAISGASGGFINGFGNGLIGGNGVGNSLQQGGRDALIGAALGGLIGGISSYSKGNNFWTGKSIPKPAVAPSTGATNQGVSTGGYERPPYPNSGEGGVSYATKSGQTHVIGENPTGALPPKLETAEITIHHSRSGIVKYYPPNGGALGSWTSTMSKVGQRMTRYGGKNGTYASPEGTPFQMRSLPHNTNPANKMTIEVLKPFPMQQSTVAPAFGQPGLGTQYKMPITFEYLEKFGYIKIIR